MPDFYFEVSSLDWHATTTVTLMRDRATDTEKQDTERNTQTRLHTQAERHKDKHRGCREEERTKTKARERQIMECGNCMPEKNVTTIKKNKRKNCVIPTACCHDGTILRNEETSGRKTHKDTYKHRQTDNDICVRIPIIKCIIFIITKFKLYVFF